MRASNARNLCTLSGLLRSSTAKLKTSKPQSYSLASSIYEDGFSDLDGDSDSTRNALEFERPSNSEKLPDLVSKQISSMLSDKKKIPRGRVRKLAKFESSPLDSSILKEDFPELNGEPKLTSFKDLDYAPLSCSESDGAEKKLSRSQIRYSSKMKSFPQALSVSEDDFSELDSEHSPSSREDLDFVQPSISENSPNLYTEQISNLLCDDQLVKRSGDDVETLEIALAVPWRLDPFGGSTSQRQKEKTRDRKKKWIFKHAQENRFERVVKFCADKLGAKATVEVLGKLGRETGVKEYNALIEVCINNARKTNDEEVAIEEMSKAFGLFRVMREQGYELQEKTYSPLLVYLIDMGMVEEFQLFSDVIEDENPSSVSRLGYYEMLLWLRVDDKEKIQDLCNSIAVNDGIDSSGLGESYLLAFCESDWKEGLLQLLEILDITKLSSTESIASIFRSLGRLCLDSYAEKFLSAFKICDNDEANNVTNFIASYVVSLPNLAVEDVFLKFKDLHQKLEVSPSSSSYEKLILYACDLLEVHLALKIVCAMCEAGFTLSTEVLNSILQSVEETCEYNLVHWIYSIISHYSLKANCETFRYMICLCTRMKDFESADKMLDDLEEMNLKPTSSMYNAIMAGYFREKNVNDALRVLERMKDTNIKPDSSTYNHLISNSKTEEDITKYYEEMKQSYCEPTKHTFVALITAYATCGQLEKAKQVVLDPAIPAKSLNEIKSALLSTLASQGQLSDSFHIYEEIKESGNSLQPKAVISLIEGHIKSDEELDRLFLLLKELTDPDYWIDGCFRIIMFCVENKHLSSAVDLIKQLDDKIQDNELVMEVLLDQVFSTIASSEESTHLKFGLDLYWLIRKVLGIVPSRQCLDFLLTACANAKDLQNIRKIWKEYQLAGYPFNVLSYVRMYRALLAAGDYKSAHLMLKKIPRDDPDVHHVVKRMSKNIQ
ncbi:hypothetical protein K1719_038911 [Acacia pycnantha]|nr:hypothetical protein K1719_038911 [Acacia pycnantha]